MRGEGAPELVMWGQETRGRKEASHRKREEMSLGHHKCKGRNLKEHGKNHPEWLASRGGRGHSGR